MSTLNALKTVSMTLVAAAICVSLQAHATTVNTFVNFAAPSQSIWGPDGPSAINYSGSASWELPLGLGTEDFGYGFDATAGTVFGNASGTLATSYMPVMSAPGIANIGLQYNSGSGSLISQIAASANLTFFNQTFGPDIGLIVNNNFVLSPLGIPSIGLNAYDIVHPSIDLGVASAGLDFGVTLLNLFTPTGIGGTLFYQREGSSVIQSQPFNLATGGALPVNLDQAGTYDFWFGSDWDLLNQFSSTAMLGLTASASTGLGCGSSGLESCHWDTTLANPALYSSDPFALSFDASAQSTSFQIEVQAVPVPAPHGLGLASLGGGILLLGVLDRRRRRRE